jgi:hypothetical protein
MKIRPGERRRAGVYPYDRSADAAKLGAIRRRCTQTITGTIAGRVRAGVPPETAARCAGVEASVFDEWMDRGARNTRGDYVFARFRRAILQAEADFEASVVKSIVTGAATGQWRAAAWLAERRWPERYMRASVRTRDDHADRSDTTPARDRVDELAQRRVTRRHREVAA